MPLMPLETLRPRLACPRCRGPLAPSLARCAAPECPLSAEGSFPAVGVHPVFVDFAHSVLEREAFLAGRGKSVVPRAARPGLLGWLHRFYARPSPATRRMARTLVNQVEHGHDPPVLLVVGGGTIGIGAEPLYEAGPLQVVAFDLYASPHTQFVGDAHRIPLADHSVEAVWIQAVLEHVLDPSRVVAEIERVLKPGGLVYAETPFMQQVHEGPYDFTRFIESGHRWLFRHFERLDSGVVAGPGTTLMWSAAHAARAICRSELAGRVVRTLLFWMQWLDGLAGREVAIDGASCVFFYGRRWDRALTPREIVAHYRGGQRRAID